jgi:hypothetical protein
MSAGSDVAMSAGSDVALFDRTQPALTGWSVNTASGSARFAGIESGALCLDYELAGHGAFVIVRRELRMTLPSHYVVTLQLRGEGAPSELQVKLVDVSGANVWWWRRPGFEPAAAGARLALRRASLDFAWGPASGGEPPRSAPSRSRSPPIRGGWPALIEDFRIEPRGRAGAPRAERVHT